MATNPYDWSNDSKNLIPGTISVKYYNDTGSLVHLSGTEPVIQYKLPVKLEGKFN